MTDLTSLTLVCTLKPSPSESSAALLAGDIGVELTSRGVSGKVALVGVVGNEDGAHHVVAQCLQALSDTGFSIPANAGTYWVGEAMQGVDYKDHDETPEKTASATRTAAANAVHLAGLLKESGYPPA